MKRALISVFDKTGIVEFAKSLDSMGWEIISTGGTSKKLKEEGIKVQDISDLTKFPECFDGRVKTLHPNVEGGILAIRDNEKHRKQMAELGVEPIDIVVCNLYPFKQTILKEGVSHAEIIENIDIGGPSLLLKDFLMLIYIWIENGIHVNTHKVCKIFIIVACNRIHSLVRICRRIKICV